jgi:hypothetical protein
VVLSLGLVAVHDGVTHGTGACVCARGRGVALGALGGTVTPGWHRHGTAQGGSKGAALRGIGRRQLGERDGEVTDRRAVGAAMPTLGVHGGCCLGSDAGENWFCSRGCEVGSWAPQGMAALSGWWLIGQGGEERV